VVGERALVDPLGFFVEFLLISFLEHRSYIQIKHNHKINNSRRTKNKRVLGISRCPTTNLKFLTPSVRKYWS
jgi:hypothetical protein